MTGDAVYGFWQQIFVKGIKQILNLQPQFRVAFELQMALEEQGVWVFLVEGQQQELPSFPAESHIGRTMWRSGRQLAVPQCQTVVQGEIHHVYLQNPVQQKVELPICQRLGQ